ncbi:hypothetical protein D3C75_617370 [compost metagenome]
MRRHPQLRFIAKLQFFDIQQAVDTVVVRQGGIRGGVVDRQAAVGITAEQIVAADIPVQRNVGFTFVAIAEDLAHDVQLARVDGAIQHLEFDVVHAVDALNRGPLCIPDFDPHVQPGIAIDNVIARFTHDAVAAAAAEDNVGAVVRVKHDAIDCAIHQGAADHLIQPGDPRHAFEG